MPLDPQQPDPSPFWSHLQQLGGVAGALISGILTRHWWGMARATKRSAEFERLTDEVREARADFNSFRDIKVSGLETRLGRLEIKVEDDHRELLQELGRMADNFHKSFNELKRRLET